MTKRKNWFLVELEMLNRNILVIWGDRKATINALQQFHDKDTVEELLEDFTFEECGKTCYSATYNGIFIWIPQLPTTAEGIGSLVHEIFHAMFAVTLNIGAVPSQDSEEFCAYMMGFLTQKIIEKMAISFSYPSCSSGSDSNNI